MKKIYYMFLIVPAMLLGCGEAGVESDISKITELSFTANANALNGVTGQTVTESVNFAAEEFEEYVSDAQSFTLNELSFEMSDVSPSTSSTLSLELRIDFANSSANNDGDVLLNLTDVVIENNNRILLYDKDNGTGAANASVVQNLESAILNGQTVQIEISASRDGDLLTDDFTYTFFWDLSARVQLDN